MKLQQTSIQISLLSTFKPSKPLDDSFGGTLQHANSAQEVKDKQQTCLEAAKYWVTLPLSH